MWRYLLPDDAAVVIYTCTNGAWGPVTLEQCIAYAQNSVTSAYLYQNEFIALFSIVPIVNNYSCWSSVWFNEKWKRKLSKGFKYTMWKSMLDLIVDKTDIQLMLGLTKKQDVINFSQRLGFTFEYAIKNLYGEGVEGYIVEWRR